jgi:glutamate 5-kinase
MEKIMSEKIIGFKIGSSSQKGEDGIDQDIVDACASKIVAVRRSSFVVASGAYIEGVKHFQKRGKDVASLSDRTIAAAGLNSASQAWVRGFNKLGVEAVPLYITHHELGDAKERSEIISFIHEALAQDVIVVCNENPLDNEELKKLAYGGDNDGLLADVAIKLGADAVFLTDEDGFLVEKELVRGFSVASLGELSMHCWEANEEGTGGMRSKVRAAADVYLAGNEAYIGNVMIDDYNKILNGQGTKMVQ